MKPNSEMVELTKKLTDQKLSNAKAITEFVDRCFLDYQIPQELINDLINERKPLDEQERFILYCLLTTFNRLYNYPTAKMIEGMLAPNEKRNFPKQKYRTENPVEFPLKFDMLQVADDQWIGNFDVKSLINLVKQQLLRYNSLTQRPMKTVRHGQDEYYTIANNPKAIRAIAKALRDGIFIPNTITLNILDTDDAADFTYDKSSKEFIINNVTYLDILDGWHRIKAYQLVSDENPDWNLPVELRITNFGVEKAHQFIYQEDQKTKMSKVDSDSFNTVNHGNLITSRVNESMKCSLRGLISRNDGIIDYACMAQLVNFFFVKGKDLSKQAETIKIVNTLISGFNALTEYDVDYAENTYSYKKLLAVMYVIHKYSEAEDKSNMPQMTDRMVTEVEKHPSALFNVFRINGNTLKELDKIWGGITDV